MHGRLDLVQGLVADQAKGFLGLGKVDRDEVTLSQQLVQRDHPDTQLSSASWAHERVIGNQVDAESAQPLSHQQTDAAEPDNADRLVRQLDAAVLGTLPFRVPQRLVSGADVAGTGQQKTHGELGGAHDVGRRRIDDHHATLGGGGNVDVVQAYTRPGDDLEVVGRGQRLSIDLGRGSNEDGVHFGDRRQQLGPVGPVTVSDLEIRSQRLNGRGGQFFGNEDNGLGH